MAGFFGLFGNKTKYVDDASSVPVPDNGNGGSYFLEPDDAKTFGNIEFMRKPKTIKRSFPKTLKGEGSKVVQEVSSMEKGKVNGNGQLMSNSSSPMTREVKSSTDTPTRRSTDSSMDMFRKMAKDMKK